MDIQTLISNIKNTIPHEYKIFPPISVKDLHKWQQSHPHIILPADLIAFLSITNGVQVWVSPGSPNGYNQFLSLQEIHWARETIWGEYAHDFKETDIPYANWLAICSDQDHSTFFVLDPDSGTYYLMDACGAGLDLPTGKSITELLDYLWHFWFD